MNSNPSKEDLEKELKLLDHLIEDTKIVIIGWEKQRETLKKQKEKYDITRR